MTRTEVLVCPTSLPPTAPYSQRSLTEHYRRSYGDVLGKREALTVLAAAIFGAAVWNGMVTYVGAFFKDELGAEGLELSAMFAAVGGSYVAGGGLGIFLARRLRPRPIAVWSALAALLLPLPVVTSVQLAPLTILLASGFAFSRAPGVAALNNMLMDLAPHSQSTAISTHGIVFMSGALLGATAGGAAIAFQGYVAMGSLFTMLAFGSALLLTLPLSAELKLGVERGPELDRPPGSEY